MASSEKVFVTLLAERGAKFDETGEAIASYNRSIVFLPRGTVPDKSYRIELIQLEKTDRRGRPLYRAVPTDVEFTERWKDLGDGTASRVKIATDWLLAESEVEVLESRPLASREGTARERSDRSIKWGTDLATSFVEVVKIKVIPLESEQVRGGALEWVKTDEREEPGNPEKLVILRVKVWAGDFEARKLLYVAYPADWTLTADCFTGDSDYVRENTVWGKLPAWLQVEVQAQYPICACGRQRREAQADGYGKCEQCRAEESCVRCCGQQAKITVLNGRMICAACQPYEEAEALITAELPMERRVEIAAEAARLLAGQAMPGEEGIVILRATVDHITSQWRRDRLLQKWAGYGWYYFCKDGVYATKLAPAALQVLRHLPQAQGNGLVELVAWLVAGPKPGSADFYRRTQINGENGVILPSITEDQLKQVAVADRLRGSEVDRQAALAGYRRLVERLGEDADAAKAVAEILQQEAQDYAMACAEIEKVEQAFARRLRRLTAGEIVEVEVNLYNSGNGRAVAAAWLIEPDGAVERFDESCRLTVDLEQLLVNHGYSNYRYQCSEYWEVHHLPNSITPQQVETVERLEEDSRRYFIGPGTGWDFSRKGAVAYATPYSRDFEGDDRELHNEQCASFPIDVTQWHVERGEDQFVVWHRHRGSEREELKRFGEQQVAQNRWVKLSFRRGRHHKTGAAQWEAGNRHVKYVLDRSADRQPVEGQAYYCSLGKVLVDTPHFRLQLVCLEPPYPEDAPGSETDPTPVPEGQEQKGEVTPEMLDALRAKFK